MFLIAEAALLHWYVDRSSSMPDKEQECSVRVPPVRYELLVCDCSSAPCPDARVSFFVCNARWKKEGFSCRSREEYTRRGTICCQRYNNWIGMRSLPTSSQYDFFFVLVSLDNVKQKQQTNCLSWAPSVVDIDLSFPLFVFAFCLVFVFSVLFIKIMHHLFVLLFVVLQLLWRCLYPLSQLLFVFEETHPLRAPQIPMGTITLLNRGKGVWKDLDMYMFRRSLPGGWWLKVSTETLGCLLHSCINLLLCTQATSRERDLAWRGEVLVQRCETMDRQPVAPDHLEKTEIKRSPEGVNTNSKKDIMSQRTLHVSFLVLLLLLWSGREEKELLTYPTAN